MLRSTAKSVAAGFRALFLALPGMMVDVAGLAGVASISYGAWLIYEPAGFIVGGVLLAGGSFRLGMLARRGR